MILEDPDTEKSGSGNDRLCSSCKELIEIEDLDNVGVNRLYRHKVMCKKLQSVFFIVTSIPSPRNKSH